MRAASQPERGVSFEDGTRGRPVRACVPRRGLRCAAAPAAAQAAAARLRRCVARPLGSHRRGRRRRVSVVARGAAAHRDELMGRFVGRVGSVRHVSELDVRRGRVAFRVPVQYERDTDELRFEGVLRGERIEGTTRTEDGARARFMATRAPALARQRRRVGRSPTPLCRTAAISAGWTPRSAEHAGCWRVAGRRARGDPAVRRSRDRGDVRRLSLARGAQISAGQQQRRLFARPLRGADPRRRAARRSTRCAWAASTASSRRQRRLPRVQPASGRRSTSSSSAAASPSR